MANGTLGLEKQDSGTAAATRKDRIALTLFGLLSAYSVMYLLVLGHAFQA